MKYIGNRPTLNLVQSYADKWDYVNSTDPTASINPTYLYASWLNTTTGVEYVCTDNTAGANVWIAIGGGGGTIDYTSPVSVTTTASITATGIGKHHICTGTTADYTVSLPTIGLTAGDLISFEMSSALTKLVTLDAGAGQLIDGVQTRVLWASENCVLKWDGTNWQKISGRSRPMSFSAHLASTYGSIPLATATNVTLDTELYDVGDCFASNKLTAKRASKWELSGSLSLFINAGGLLTRALGYFNISSGTYIPALFDYQDGNYPTSTGFHMPLALNVDLSAADTVELQVYGNSTSGTVSVHGHATGQFNCCKMTGHEVLDW